MATALIQKMKFDKGAFYMGSLRGETCEQNR